MRRSSARMSSLDATPSSIGWRVASLQLVDAVQVSGVGHGDAQHAARELVRDRDDALQHVQRNLLRCVSRDARHSHACRGSQRIDDHLVRGLSSKRITARPQPESAGK